MNRKIKKFVLSFVLASVIMPTSFAFADEGLEREFTIDVSKPNVVEEIDTKKDDKTKETKEDGFTVNVSPEKKVQSEETKKKVAEKYKPKIEKNPFKPTNQGNAKGRITENVGADNKKYPIRKEIKSEVKNDNNASGTNKRPEADARQFLTFTTKSGKVFHLIVNHDKTDENVQLLTEVTEQDLLNMILENTDDSKLVEEEKPKVEKKTEEVKKEEPKKEKSGSGSFLILGLVALGVLGAGYYLKIYKPKHEDTSDFEEFEEDDDYFSDESEESHEDKKEIKDEDLDDTMIIDEEEENE